MAAFKLGDLVQEQEVPQQRPCWRKLAHETREEAEAQRQSMADRGWGDDQLLDVYLCSYCHRWHVGHNRQKERSMDDVQQALKNGGVVTVFCGTGFDVPSEFVLHPQVRAVSANQLSQDKVVQAIDSNTRAAIVTDDINHRTFLTIDRELRRRRIVYLRRKSQASLDATLRDIFPEKPGLVDPTPYSVIEAEKTLAAVAKDLPALPGPLPPDRAPRGAVPSLVEEFWETLSQMTPAEGGRWLLPKAQERGIPTTLGSLQQQVRLKKRESSHGEIQTENLKVVKILDDSIAGLQLVRDYVARTEARNVELQAKLDLLAETFGKVVGD